MTLKRIRSEDLSETFVLLFAGVETLDKCYTQTTVKVEQELFNWEPIMQFSIFEEL